ncbi:MmgE/PrpD family protein [Marinivivus vitaminiproducens]|uniref:MmgE/PrpD family protein n=1 Tax=Marinivivus vitaminiproducens TaxID=3035935 RepID=UPI0027A96B31|nr:MmgE/PrpD family protein [Geminicoccaceae bacterium SCSIO 64248]
MTDAIRTRALAAFVASTGYDDLPPAVRTMTLEVVRDGIGAMAAAANPAYSTGRLIAAFARDQGGRDEASVVGHGFRTSAVMAALANGTMGYACDFEPHHPEAILHPIAVMVPTALAVAERVGASGSALLAAVAIGCEVEYRVSRALGPAEQYALGFHPSAVCGAFGAAAAAACLLKLPEEAVARALGLAACQASGLMAWESDPTENARPFQMGMAARNGVTAALLAGSGFGGPPEVFDHGHTVFKAFSRAPEPQRLTEDLGTAFDGILELAIKPYSCVSFLHPGLDALFALAREEGLRADDVESVTLRFPKDGIHCVDGNPLRSHCAQYVLSVALVRGALAVADLFTDRRLDDPAVADLSRRVRVESDPELDRLFPAFYASIVDVRTRGGRRLRSRRDIARGYPEAPLSPAELDAKFRALAGSVWPVDTVEALAGAIDDLPAAPDLQSLAAVLREPAGTVGA